MAWDGTLNSEWNFDTIRSAAAPMGTIRTMVKELTPSGFTSGTIPDETDSAYGSVTRGRADSLDTSAAMKGSDIPSVVGGAGGGAGGAGIGIGINTQALHSTMVIRSPVEEPDVQTLLEEAGEDSGEPPASSPPTSPTVEGQGSPELGAPPAYVRTPTKRNSYAARNAAGGTIVREADLGTGVDTIRPVKKVDAAGSLRLSSEYVGSIRREGSTSTPTSPSSSPVKERSASARKRVTGEAGRAVVDEVVLPTLQRVCGSLGRMRACWLILFLFLSYVLCRQLRTTWMLVRSSLLVCCREVSKSFGRPTLKLPTTSSSTFFRALTSKSTNP